MAQLASTTIYGDLSVHSNATILGNVRIDGPVSIGVGAITNYMLAVEKDTWEYIFSIKQSNTDNRLIFNSGTAYASISAGASNRNDITILHSNGNIGIGTTNPSYKLHVNGTLSASQIYIGSTRKDNLWDTAYNERRQWDGGATNLNASTARTSLGLTGDSNTTHYHDGRYYQKSESDNLYLKRTSANDVDIRLASQNGRGLRFWDSDNYKIWMSAATDSTWGGRLDSSSDYNMYFRMAGGAARGFVFKNGATNIAQIDGYGNFYTVGDINVSKNNAWFTLKSSTSGANGVEQAAGISVGESGYKGSAALHFTYTGDGYGHIGMGTVNASTSLPQYEAIRLYYQNNYVVMPGRLMVGSTSNPSYALDVQGDVRFTGTLQGGTIPWDRLDGTAPVNKLPNASTSARGVVQLSTSTSSTSTTVAATASAVKAVNDALNAHKTSGDHDGRYPTRSEVSAIAHPIGSIIYAATNGGESYLTNAGFLRCDGRVLLQSQYPTLFQRVGRLSNWPGDVRVISRAARGLAYGNGMWVAVGDGGTIFTSTNGTSWTSRSSGVSNTLYGVAYGNGMWVAVGASSTIRTSTNGTSWTSRSTGTSIHLYGVAYGDGMWVATGENANFFTSTNGTSWTRRGTVGSDNLYGAAYGNGVWVIVGQNGSILTSTGGTSWTDLGTVVSEHLRGVAYANGTWVVVGDKGRVLTSTNGTSWTSRSTGTSHELRGVAYGNHNRMWVAAGEAILAFVGALYNTNTEFRLPIIPPIDGMRAYIKAV